MDQLRQLLASVNLNLDTFWKSAIILVLGSILLGVLGRFVFGKKSLFLQSVSSAIGILFVYAATVVLYSMGARYQAFVAPLPLVSFSGTQMTFFRFTGADYTVICDQILSMIILAFLANILDGFLPVGKKLLSWLFFRILTVVLAMAALLVLDWLCNTYLPAGLTTYAPTIILGLLLLMLGVGALKIPIGVLLSTVSPAIGAFYTFFFATVLGRAISKAVLTTMILGGIVYALEFVGVAAVSIASAALVAYIPLLIALAAVWYVVSRLL